MSRRSEQTWISVLIATVIVVGILAVVAIGSTAFFIYRHVNTEITANESADVQFMEARKRFAGQQPLIEIRNDDEPVLHREVIPASIPAAKLDTLRVLAYDTREGKLVRVSIPFWLLRLAPTNHMTFLRDTGIDFDSDRVRLTLDDLERRGPGLILDQAGRHGSQVLVWTE